MKLINRIDSQIDAEITFTVLVRVLSIEENLLILCRNTCSQGTDCSYATTVNGYFFGYSYAVSSGLIIVTISASSSIVVLANTMSLRPSVAFTFIRRNS
jgi:hypothetical protein